MDCTTLKRVSCVVVLILVATAASANAAPTLEESYVSPVTITTEAVPIEKSQRSEERGKMTKRMVLPLLVGILLKVGSLLPVILGKLTLMAFGSIMTSKLALLMATILVIHKFQADYGHTTAPAEDSYSYAYRRRG